VAELFVFGTFWFWVLTVAAIIIITALEEWEYGSVAMVCLLIYGGLLQWAGKVNILGYLWQHPIYTVTFLAGYFLIGTIWGVGKWAIFVKGKSQDLVEVFRDYCETHKIAYTKPIDPDVWAKFEQEVNGEEYDATKRNQTIRAGNPAVAALLKAPRIRDHKERFIRWLSFWPMSVLYTCFNDLLRNLGKQIYAALAERLQGISDGIYRRALPKGFEFSPQDQKDQMVLIERQDDPEFETRYGTKNRK
jgi:hypothetical protein